MLPEEILLYIFSFLTPQALHHISTVSKSWRIRCHDSAAVSHLLISDEEPKSLIRPAALLGKRNIWTHLQQIYISLVKCDRCWASHSSVCCVLSRFLQGASQPLLKSFKLVLNNSYGAEQTHLNQLLLDLSHAPLEELVLKGFHFPLLQTPFSNLAAMNHLRRVCFNERVGVDATSAMFELAKPVLTSISLCLEVEVDVVDDGTDSIAELDYGTAAYHYQDRLLKRLESVIRHFSEFPSLERVEISIVAISEVDKCLPSETLRRCLAALASVTCLPQLKHLRFDGDFAHACELEDLHQVISSLHSVTSLDLFSACLLDKLTSCSSLSVKSWSRFHQLFGSLPNLSELSLGVALPSVRFSDLLSMQRLRKISVITLDAVFWGFIRYQLENAAATSPAHALETSELGGRRKAPILRGSELAVCPICGKKSYAPTARTDTHRD